MHSNLIPALVKRHAGDAAFYWTLHNKSALSPHLQPERLWHFSQLLGAHLEGLQVAGPAGLVILRGELQRWRGAGEAFALAWAAIRLHDEAALAQLLAEIRQQPDSLLRGLISALACLPASDVAPLITAWSQPGAGTVEAVAALRAIALRPDAVAGAPVSVPDHWLQHESPHVRAAACRVAAALPVTPPAALDALRNDADSAVRAEAAIALAHHGLASGAAATLLRSVQEQLAVLASASGWYQQQAQRRLQRWLRHLAWLVPPGHPDVPALLEHLPPRQALHFVLQHGDPALRGFVLRQLEQPEHARLAGWVWQTLTGVDLHANGLLLPEPPYDPDQPLHEANPDADDGLPLPNPAAVRACDAALSLPVGQRLLLGQPHSPENLLMVLHEAPQALRQIATRALRQFAPQHGLNIRAPWWQQHAALAALSGAER
ncbi:hypothetical protein ABHF33_01255 [Chitinibacter sp. FCG-7]|uniref:HEAT repeat domain-containing protein n=1 Tax=Chitinibacter mangrovi TaxID=3153927 RepID=A0AAU7FA50_9NEIS